MPKEFVKASDVLPITTFGVSSLKEFQKAEQCVQFIEYLKKADLTDEEIKLFLDNEKGVLSQHTKIEANILKDKLRTLYNKLNQFEESIKSQSIQNNDDKAKIQAKSEEINDPFKLYPSNHPIHRLNELEESLFAHLKHDTIMPITKRRKLLRRLERKKERVMAQQQQLDLKPSPSTSSFKSGSLWDVKYGNTVTTNNSDKDNEIQRKIFGPKPQTMYTIKDKKIVRLEPDKNKKDEYCMVDIVVPQNKAEEKLLEGTKMSLEDIKSIDRFKDYQPGKPSKVLYLKNIAASVTEDELSLLFKQFEQENGMPVELRLLSGRMRGQAFVKFTSEFIINYYT
ncbi:unnamed protein product [Leptidea sinapis]|uniref:RRM domain-containing protein n=1 Tax=Leptidea sinapis TaxID=189913 RepID=A0A5E4QX16_9NEOP|nr:unnamed protein product [Leptidea sinapis]